MENMTRTMEVVMNTRPRKDVAGSTGHVPLRPRQIRQSLVWVVFAMSASTLLYLTGRPMMIP
jgi:hypothetical protein